MKQSQPVTRNFCKSTPALIAAVLAVGLLAGASRGLAVTMTWTNGNGVWTSTTAWQTNLATGTDPVGLTNLTCVAGDLTNVTATCAPGGSGAFPGTGDTAMFTNSPVVTINISTNVRNIEVSNAVVSFVAGASTLLTVTDAFSVGSEDVSALTTATVYWGGGTLAITNGGAANVEIGTGTNEMGQLYVTNGVVVYDENHPPSTSDTGMTIGGAASAGMLVISGSGVVTNGVADTSTISIRGDPTMTSQLIITNGGKLFVNGAIETKSNVFVLVSDPGSILSNSFTGTSVISIGVNNILAPGSRMIVSNGATVWSEGTISFGRGSSYNTGLVCGAGSRLISDTNGGFIIGITGGSSNALVVYNGGYLRSGGLLQVPDGATCPNNTFQMGGVGAMSTGLLVQVRQNSGSTLGSIIVTNAVLTCSTLEVEGGPSNSLSVLSNGTLIFSNQYAVSATTTNVLIAESFTAGYGNAVTINAGTISAVSGSNVVQVEIGSSGESGAASLTITNGGKLLSELAEIGSSSSYNTGLVTGAGSVWSNFTAGVGYVNTNQIKVGVGSTASGAYNCLAVQNGASLVNNGDLGIGDDASSTFNAVVFGGPGAPAVIINSGSVNVGAAPGTSGNSLTISNASLTCDTLNVGTGTNRTDNSLAFNGGTISADYIEIGGTSTVVFTAGTLGVGGFKFDSGANNGTAFVVGDGVSAAYYDMTVGGTGYHDFSAGGLVVTNGATLSGTGTIVGETTVLGTLSPGFGASVGTITASNDLVLGSSTVLQYALGLSSDETIVNGSLTLDGTINVSNSGGLAAGNYVIFTYGSLVNNRLIVGSMPGGFSATVSNDAANLRILLVVTGGASNPFTTWQNYYFGCSGCPQAQPNADPYGKGISNTNQFMAGFNPTNTAAYLHIINVAKTNNNADIRVTYLGANGDSSYTGGPTTRTNVLEFTTGTANGSYTNNFASTGQTNILSGGTGLGVVTNMVDSGGATNKPSRYYRVRVLLP
jgi:hypothetical protein